MYGVDWGGPVNEIPDVELIDVHENNVDLSEQVEDLKESVDPLSQCDDVGVSLYVAARAYVSNCF